AGKKAMVVAVQIKVVGNDLIGFDRLRAGETVAEAAAEDVADDHQLIAGHRRLCRVGFRVDVNQLGHPVAVAAGGGGVEVGSDAARYAHFLIEHRRGPGQSIHTVVGEALVFGLPGVPAAAGPVGLLNWAMAVGDRMGGVGDVGVPGLRVGSVSGRSEGKLPVGGKVELAGGDAGA